MSEPTTVEATAAQAVILGEINRLANSSAVIAQQINVHERRIGTVEREAEVTRGIAHAEREQLRIALKDGLGTAQAERQQLRVALTEGLNNASRVREELLGQQTELLTLNQKQSEVIAKVERFVLSSSYTDDIGEKRPGLLRLSRELEEHLRWFRRIGHALVWLIGMLFAAALGIAAFGHNLGWW
ncbi:MAG: hypothetical protein EHM39_00945 [Chloroflexi bacterium]|nr:MAG: hypothetical protein EHM39_00945 [Chloroflexota bacterium]